jgi:hypothetical protein
VAPPPRLPISGGEPRRDRNGRAFKRGTRGRAASTTCGGTPASPFLFYAPRRIGGEAPGAGASDPDRSEHGAPRVPAPARERRARGPGRVCRRRPAIVDARRQLRPSDGAAGASRPWTLARLSSPLRGFVATWIVMPARRSRLRPRIDLPPAFQSPEERWPSSGSESPQTGARSPASLTTQTAAVAARLPTGDARPPQRDDGDAED